MKCASRLIECPHCAASGCRNERCANLVLASGRCTRCGAGVKKPKPLHRVCKREIGQSEPSGAPFFETPARQRTPSAAIASLKVLQLPAPRPTAVPRHSFSDPAMLRAAADQPARVVAPPVIQRGKWSLFSGTAAVVLLLALGGYASQSAFRPAPRASRAQIGIFADAASLSAHYGRDAAQARELFNGRSVTLSGRIERVADDHLSVRAREVAIRCSLGRKTTAREREILRGTDVTLRGKVKSSPERERVDLEACELLAELD